MPERHLISAGLLIFGSLILLATMVLWSINDTPPVLELTFLYVVLSANYLYAVHYFGSVQDQKVIHVLVAASILSRFVLIFAPTTLSSDIYRYLWEGAMMRHGVSPYEFAPLAPELAPYRTTYFPMIEHAHLSAIYPPVAQYLFAACAWGALSWKAFLFLCECGTICIFIQILKKRGLPAGRVVIYSFLPLSLCEISVAGHLEGIGVLLIALLLWLACQIGEKPHAFFQSSALGVTAALALLLKYVGILPFFFLILKRHLSGRNLMIAAAAFLTAATLLLAPFLRQPLQILQSLGVYLGSWRFNDSLFRILGELASVDWARNDTFNNIKLMLAALWILVLAFMFKRLSFEQLSLYGLALLLLFGPVFHPWYALWFAPFLLFVNSSALTYLVLALPLSYQGLMTGRPQPSDLMLAIEFIPVYLLLITDTVRKSPVFVGKIA